VFFCFKANNFRDSDLDAATFPFSTCKLLKAQVIGFFTMSDPGVMAVINKTASAKSRQRTKWESAGYDLQFRLDRVSTIVRATNVLGAFGY